MENPSLEYKIVRANDQNIGDLARIFKESKGLTISVEYLKRKFDTHYTGKTYFAHFAYAPDGSPAAFFCLFPCFLRINGQKFLAGQSADIITHIAHQRKGLFGLLGKATEQLAAQEGMNFLFAFPNDNSYPGFTRSLHWHTISQFQIHAFKSRAFPIYRALTKFRLGKVYAAWAKWILRRSTPPTGSFKGEDWNSGTNVHWRDESYSQYKRYNPSFMLSLKGIRIWAKIEGRLVVGDIQLIENVSILEVVSQISRLCRHLGLDEWILEASKGSFWDSKLQDISEIRQGVQVVYKNLERPTEILPLNFAGSDADVF